jgi:integrase/recombinase XerD
MSQNLTSQFRMHLERLGYSQSSVQMLPTCLKEFLEYTAKETDKIQPADITHYYHYLQERPNKRRPGGLSECFINHHIYSLKLFFAWQLESGKINENPISILTFPSPKSRPREVLTILEIKQLYKACETYRERAVLSLFYGCVLRRSEGVKLNLKDVHFRNNLLYVREGKGNKRRAVPMSEAVKNDLWHYVINERLAGATELAFMTNKHGNRTSGSTLNRLLKDLLRYAEIDIEASLHSLRHSIATHLLEGGLSVEYVRDFLGHKHLESTQLYTRVNTVQLWNLKNT